MARTESIMPRKQSAKYPSWRLAAAFAVTVIAAQYFLGGGLLRQPAPATLESCLNDFCADCVRSAENGMSEWVKPFNLGRTVAPAAVVRPRNAQEVAGVVKCAVKHDVKVQAVSGGHSFGNYGLGGDDGAVSVDLQHFQHVTVDTSDPSMSTLIGGGTRLGQVHEQLFSHQRAIPHGVCPYVGMGGQATVGGFGPISRMWGTTLDHIEEVEVVTANGTIVRASDRQNSDLFFAMRGAGAGFGIVTEFVMRTHPAPQEILHYNQNYRFNHLEEMIDVFQAWQTLVLDSALDQRLGTEFTFTPHGAHVSATWYGSEHELQDSGILDKLPFSIGPIVLRRETWESSSAKHALDESRHIQSTPGKFLFKSLGFTQDDALSREDIANLFSWLESQNQGSSSWSVKFTAGGGVVAETPMSATAFAHRDKLMFYQSYAAGDSKTTKNLLDGLHRKILNAVASDVPGTYPGFADPELRDPQTAYWGNNLPALEEIKAVWDPKDVFHNPQSVRPQD